MNKAVSFDDVLIVPKFSTVKSRKDVDLTSLGLKLPVISANMDTVTGVEMSKAMSAAGGAGALHRFWEVSDNVTAFRSAEVKPWVSVGLGNKELDRAVALLEAGAETFVLDVAHGASIDVVKRSIELRKLFKDNAAIIVGNFATASSIQAFIDHGGQAEVFKVGIGGGSACTTRIKTGCGLPTLFSVMDCSKIGVPVIADGGMRTPGDVAKALAAGASAVMLGGMLAGTTETPGEVIYPEGSGPQCPVKSYRGSASQESYGVQGKDESWRTTEGESFTVPYKGPVSSVLKDIEGGLRSALSYTGSHTISEFQANSQFIEVSQAGAVESGSHGKK